MSEVFLSYARDDEATARRVARALESAGHHVWWDSHLPAHRSYAEEIEHRLGEAEAVVVLWSRAAARSQWVRAEADFARNQGKLVQAQLDDALPPMPFNQIQCASLTGWRGSPKHAGWAKLAASVAALVGDKGQPAAETPASAPPPARSRRWLALAGVLVLLLVGALIAIQLWQPDDARRPRVAVLPFESFDQRDSSLVAGIWEDTRQAIGRNPQLMVLGPNSAREIAEARDGAGRKLADYLVKASVRSAGDRIRVSANLVRSSDGIEIWSKSFDRRLDDMFALQSEIAGEIEGHIRGRLAVSGGVKPENIATSGEVYALYSDARDTFRRRDSIHYESAREQLRRVVRMDPNFAPGWAALSVAEQFHGPTVRNTRPGLDRQGAQVHARRAIELAPNLAAGHSALGFALRRGPAAEAALQRAIKLDPNDYESISWLANLYNSKAKTREALNLYSRAVEIEPLFWPAVLNKLSLLLDLGDSAAVEGEWTRIQSAGSPLLSALAGMEIAKARGDLSEAAMIGRKFLKSDPNKTRGIVGFPLFGLLLQLGFVEEAQRAFPPPPFGPALWANDPRGLDMVAKLGLRPRQFFALHPLPMNAGRVYILRGRGKELAAIYREAAATPEEMVAICGSELDFAMLAPFIALGLRQAGDEDEARRLLVAAERSLAIGRIDRRGWRQMLFSRLLAVQGDTAGALDRLDQAVASGWLPLPPQMRPDIAEDPAFESLRSDPRFEASRQKILRHLARERAELGAVRLD